MALPTVLIIGCGIAGPAIAILLRERGYHPIVFEKVRNLGNAGASIMMKANGLKVLNLMGLAEPLVAESVPVEVHMDHEFTGEIIGQTNVGKTFEERFGWPLVGVMRSSINLELKQKLVDLGIDIREGWGLTTIKEDETSVTAFFSNGKSVTGSILIACDGVKSASRAALLKGDGEPTYTGLTQTCLFAETPKALRGPITSHNWYGRGIHVVCYPVSPTHSAMAVTQVEAKETAENWRPFGPDELPTQKELLCKALKGFVPEVLEVISTSDRVIKFGLFDRDELETKQWYTKRCVLIGDAAHPTSPHIGQGANQALEDCYHLSQLLPDLSSVSEGQEKLLGGDLANTVFHPFAEKRQPRTSLLVKAARAHGELRVVTSPKDIEARNAIIRRQFENNGVLFVKSYDDLNREPFDGR
ncbi:3-hydroxybenzoate 6-hydroxylase-like protein [Cladobotryum mycophilum]|uniref:3-hydroxybenzoate 6-hydroxylase-like protein n=1 Tax=Cladobotryum mycophilum TaxID=491253 RepID=A0ABR0SYT6_9HYPO